MDYRHFLGNDLPILLEELPHLLTDHWIERGETQSLPPRSLDLNRLDYFMWRHLKTLAYTTPV